MDIAASMHALNGQDAAQEREFRLIAPVELHAYWPLVKAGVEKVAERGSDGWLPEDVYMALKQSISLLYVAFVSQYYVGFAVVTPTIGWNGPQLHIWCLYNRGERDVLDTFLPDLIALAKSRGAQRMTMSSPRRGWEKRAAQLGFEPGLITYGMEI